ncbi:MAG: F-box protein [Parachlamydiales bacterium]|nr:F-box protein [Parachlamydiales bacterium]
MKTNLVTANSDLASLPPQIIKNHLSQFIDPLDISKMNRVSKAWNRIFDSNDFWGQVLKSFPFLRNYEGSNFKKAYQIELKNNIDHVHCESKELKKFDSIKYNDFKIDSLQCYRDQFTIISNNRLYKVSDQGDITAIPLTYDVIVAQTVLDNNLYVLDAVGEIRMVELNGSSTELTSTSMEKLDRNHIRNNFLSCLNGKFVFSSNFWLSVIRPRGSETSLKLHSTAVTIFDKLIVVGTRKGHIEFYNESLDLIKTFKSPIKDKNEPQDIYCFTNFQNKLVSTGYDLAINVWDSNGQCTDLSSDHLRIIQMEPFHNNLVALAANKIYIFNKDGLLKNIDVLGMRIDGFKTLYDKIIVFGESENTFKAKYSLTPIRYLDFSPQCFQHENNQPDIIINEGNETKLINLSGMKKGGLVRSPL